MILVLFFEPMLLPGRQVQSQQSPGIIPETGPANWFSPVVKAAKSETELPAYLIRTPKGHFAGVSAPSKDIRTARMSAIDNALEQIIRTMGVTCSLSFRDTTFGNIAEIKREIDDDLSIEAEWFVKEIEQNIVKTDFVIGYDGVYTFFVLIRFPDGKVERMRRLTVGPNVTVRLVEMDEHVARIEAAETNGVKVALYEYEINAEISYSRAAFVSYYIWKVAQARNTVSRGTLACPLVLNGNSRLVRVPIPHAKTGIGDYLLGASRTLRIVLIGYDEIGRRVVKQIDL